MVKLKETLLRPKGRRLEFKATMPTNAELAKTIVNFVNIQEMRSTFLERIFIFK